MEFLSRESFFVGIHKREREKRNGVWPRVVASGLSGALSELPQSEKSLPRLGKAGDGASRVGGGAKSEAGGEESLQEFL